MLRDHVFARVPRATLAEALGTLSTLVLMPLASTRHTRTSTRCRSLATKRSSVVAPGNNTLWALRTVLDGHRTSERTVRSGDDLDAPRRSGAAARQL